MLNTNAKTLRFLSMNMQPRWRRRVAGVASYAFHFVAMLLAPGSGMECPRTSILGDVDGAVDDASPGGFRDRAFVKSFYVRRQPPAEMLRVGSLDEWARYKYGTAGFEESSAEQQEDLLKDRRVGTYLMPRSGSRDTVLGSQMNARLGSKTGRRGELL